jgi:DNA-binding transcriptional LysR family regulator
VDRAIRLRIHVTGLDAMCRMIHNGLGVGVMPRRAFELMHGVGDLDCVPLTDAWASARSTWWHATSPPCRSPPACWWTTLRSQGSRRAAAAE